MFKIKSIYLLLILLCVSTVSAATVSNFSTGQSSLVSIPFIGSNTSTTFQIYKYATINSSYFNLTGVAPINNLGFESGNTNEWNFVGDGGVTNTLPAYILSTYIWSGTYYFDSFVETTGGCDSGYLNRILYKSNQSELTILAYANYHYRIGGTSPLNYSDFDLSLYNETAKVATLYSNNVSSEYSSNITINLNLSAYQGNVFTLNLTQNACTPSGAGTWYSDFLIDIAHTSNVTANINGGSNFYNSNGYFTSTNITTNFTSQLQTYLNSCTMDSNGLCLVPLNISSQTPGLINLTNLNITYSFQAGLLTRVRNADTNGLINGTQLILSNTTTQYTTIINYSGNDTVFLPLSVIPSGSVTLTYSATGYDTATYNLVLDNISVANLTAFLQNNTAANAISVTILVRNTNNVQIENALVEIYRSINGTYMLVGQDYTDGTGQITAVLDSTLLYSLQISKSGYNTRNQTLNPVSSLVTITLSSAVSAVPETPLQNLYWLLEPDLISTQIQPFSLTINTTTNSLEWYNVTLVMNNGTVLNTTSGSNSNGGKITITYNVSKLYNALSNQTIILKGYFKKVNQSQYQFFNVKIYTLYSIPSFNYTGNASVNAIKDSSVNSNNKPSPLFAGLLVFAIILVVSGSVYMQSGARTPSLALGVIILTFFAYIGWIDWILWLPIVLIALGLAKGEDRR